MREVRVALAFPASVHEAETCWYDTSRWPAWVDELARVVEVAGDWPQVGAGVIWESGPAGRGRVRERVVAYEPLAGQSLDVHDDSIQGRQSVAFTPADDGVEVALSLEYEISKRSIFTPLVDLLFIRRAMETSLRTTVSRFGVELAARHPSRDYN
jgi:polyketide cyclase/dehydrase/lipid transport protein